MQKECSHQRWVAWNKWLGATAWCLISLADAKVLPVNYVKPVASLACVLRLGNSSSDLHAFNAAARTWGAKCRWFLGLASTHSVAEDAKRIVNGSRARILEVPLASSASALEVILRTYQVRGAFPGGPPERACGLTDTSIFLVLENLLPHLQASHHLPFSASCGSRILCQTTAATALLGALPLSLSLRAVQENALRLPLCGRRPEEVCNTGGGPRYATALHVGEAAGHHSLFASIYLAWPLPSAWHCNDNSPLAARGFTLPGQGNLPRVAVLIGSLLRSPASSILILGRLFLEQVQYQIFVYTPPIVKARACEDAISVFLGDYIGAKLKVSTVNDTLDEEKFQWITGSGHMRQWYKHRMAYAMMEEQERVQGWKYDLVLKMRTDLELHGALSLADFPELATARVIYSALDLMFFSNREVAQILFDDILEKLASRAGNERRLLPLNYDRILRTGEATGLSLQVFPDVKDLGEALKGKLRGGLVLSLIRKYRGALEAAHVRAETENVPIVSGHWRFRNDSKQYQYWQKMNRTPRDHEMCSVRHWFYHVHRAEPEVLMRPWIRPLMNLSKTRHYQHCNCEPPVCIPDGWPVPWPEHPP